MARNTVVAKATLLLAILKVSAGQTLQACQQLRVENEKYIKADGLYLINKKLKVSWTTKPVYQLQSNIDRIIFYNKKEGWCIGKKGYTVSGNYWYRLGRENKLGDDMVWKTALGTSNTTVKCVGDKRPHNDIDSLIMNFRDENNLKTLDKNMSFKNEENLATMDKNMTFRNGKNWESLDKKLLLTITITKILSEGNFC